MNPKARPASKVVTVEEAIADVRPGAVVMVGGFGGAGTPVELRDALADREIPSLRLVANNADFGRFLYDGGMDHLTCSFPVGPTAPAVLQAIEDGRVEMRLIPQGTLAEMIRAAGAGLGGVLTPTGVGLEYGEQFQQIDVDGRRWLLAPALRGDVALVKGAVADRIGNVVCRSAGINFNPAMAMAGACTIAQVERVVDVGEIEPEDVTIPGVFVDRVVELPRREGRS